MHGLSHIALSLPAVFGQHGVSLGEHLGKMSGFLSIYYLALATMNACAAYFLWKHKKAGGTAIAWLGLGLVYTILSALAGSGTPGWVPAMPAWVISAVNTYFTGTLGAILYTVGTIVVLVVMFVCRRFFVQGWVAWSILNFTVLVMGLSMADPNFAAIVTKPDNVPIVALIYLLGFFTWLATARAVDNDERTAKGLPTREKEESEKVLVWPDLVYIELICMVALTAVLLFWAIGLQAPLEEPASRVKTPNPSKAPWYFLGLQEMLVYFDPWYAGVVLPSVVLAGLALIPYLDFNKKGNGYYTIAERKFSYLTFQFGFLVLWITLIILGTFLRGPNWNLFAPYEEWDPHKVASLNNIDLSYWFWEILLGQGMPKAPPGTGGLAQVPYILLRELPGILLVAGYMAILPPLMAMTVFRKFYVKMGFIRYIIMANLFLLMMTLPLKMILRWAFNLKYLISIPEYFLNF